VVTQHHAWAKRGGIDFFAMAWSGAGSKHVEWSVTILDSSTSSWVRQFQPLTT